MTGHLSYSAVICQYGRFSNHEKEGFEEHEICQRFTADETSQVTFNYDTILSSDFYLSFFILLAI